MDFNVSLLILQNVHTTLTTVTSAAASKTTEFYLIETRLGNKFRVYNKEKKTFSVML